MRTNTFENRRKIHDNIALPSVDYIFSLMDYSHFSVGIEKEAKNFRHAMESRNDPLALKFRFAPDRLYAHPEKNIIICEVKSEYKNSPNFAIEFDSYLQATKFNEYDYLYAFVEIKQYYHYLRCYLQLCQGSNIPVPTRFLLPAHHKYRELFQERIKTEFPVSNIAFIDNSGGSGTPFFLVPKKSDFLYSPGRYFDNPVLDRAILFNENTYKMVDMTSELFTHKYHGGLFFRLSRSEAWSKDNQVWGWDPPMVTYALTLESDKMKHRDIWTFTDISWAELMIPVSDPIA